jgi:hypothetical protein
MAVLAAKLVGGVGVEAGLGRIRQDPYKDIVLVVHSRRLEVTNINDFTRLSTLKPYKCTPKCVILRTCLAYRESPISV